MNTTPRTPAAADAACASTDTATADGPLPRPARLTTTGVLATRDHPAAANPAAGPAPASNVDTGTGAPAFMGGGAPIRFTTPDPAEGHFVPVGRNLDAA